MKDILNIEKQEFNYLGKKSDFEGKFTMAGTSFITGNIKGEIEMQNNATLIVEREGKVSGTINCYDLEVFGTVSGKILSEGTVTLHPSASITGTVSSSNLIVKPGAVLNIDCATTGEN